MSEDVTILPDGSAFAIGKFPLSETHWLYSEKEDKELTPVIDVKHRDDIKLAVRTALRDCTDKGTDMDFDPDALVINVCNYLVGYINTPTEND